MFGTISDICNRKQNKMKKLVLFTFYILLATSSVFSQDVDEKSQAILNKLSSKMKVMKSFYLEFSANIKNNATGMNETSTGKGWVKDKKFYASYGDNTILSNGLKTWTIVKEEKIAFNIGIDLPKIMSKAGRNSKYDLILKEGDQLIIPGKTDMIEVQGQVLSPSLIRYEPNKSLKEYINNSGGFSDMAKKSKIYVTYANGDIKSTKHFLFFKTYPKIRSGSTILVPEKIKKEGIGVQGIVGLTTSLATLGVLINTLLANY